MVNKMIVKDKEERLHYYGAIQFNRREALKSLMNYPGIKRDIEKDKFTLDGTEVFHSDWLVTDEEGRTKIYTDNEFRKEFTNKDGEQL